MSKRPVNLKRLRMEVIEHRYQTMEMDVNVMLQLIDELQAAREKLETHAEAFAALTLKADAQAHP